MKATIRRISICMLVVVITLCSTNISTLAASKKSYTDEELKLLTSIVYCEARGESYKGKVAVANVVINRVNSSKFPNTIKKVIYQKNQFTPARSGSLAKALKEYAKNPKASKFKECKKAAKAALEGKKEVKSSVLFFSGYKRSGYSVAQSKKLIKKKYPKAIFIGNHYFR